jgi:seryl-tRNA synthetase
MQEGELIQEKQAAEEEMRRVEGELIQEKQAAEMEMRRHERMRGETEAELEAHKEKMRKLQAQLESMPANAEELEALVVSLKDELADINSELEELRGNEAANQQCLPPRLGELLRVCVACRYIVTIEQETAYLRKKVEAEEAELCEVKKKLEKSEKVASAKQEALIQEMASLLHFPLPSSLSRSWKGSRRSRLLRRAASPRCGSSKRRSGSLGNTLGRRLGGRLGKRN